MCKIETTTSKLSTSNVSLKLTSRINLGRQGARAEVSTLDTAHKAPPSPTAWQGLTPGQLRPIVPTGTINKPFRTAKAASDGKQEKPPKARRARSAGSFGAFLRLFYVNELCQTINTILFLYDEDAGNIIKILKKLKNY